MGKKREGGDDPDKDLWLKVAKTVKPYHRRGPCPSAAVSRTKTKAGAGGTTVPVFGRQMHADPCIPRKPTARDIDAATARKMKRGQLEIEGRIDLHGLSRHKAEEALMRFIDDSVHRGRRTVLVITGKSGVLRGLVPRWLEERPAVLLAARPARPKDGGDGALYVRLRRKSRGN